MKFRRALKLLRLFLSAQAARNVAERSRFGIHRRRWGGAPVLCDGCAIDGGVLRFLLGRGRCSQLVLACFQLGAIFSSEDLIALQVVGRINVSGFFLLVLFAGAFLASSFGNTSIILSLDLILGLSLVLSWLRLCVANGGARKGK
ncbi:MAG: hypothetical protein DMG38_20715 [Acidobacteria bacterium]|nr:MAG: hypothetical protein DMG38_20715 [Acidobacteriota bacterium]